MCSFSHPNQSQNRNYPFLNSSPHILAPNSPIYPLDVKQQHQSNVKVVELDRLWDFSCWCFICCVTVKIWSPAVIVTYWWWYFNLLTIISLSEGPIEHTYWGEGLSINRNCDGQWIMRKFSNINILTNNLIECFPGRSMIMFMSITSRKSNKIIK